MAGVLDELEAQVAALPAASVKDDMDPGFDAMAAWVDSVGPARRPAVLEALPRWLDDGHPWHSRAVMELALRLRSEALLSASIGHAQALGDPTIEPGAGYPPALTYQLNLLSVISRWPGDPGHAARGYLRSLRMAATDAATFPSRLLGIRAWFTECLLMAAPQRSGCIDQGLALVRSWRDPQLLRSGLSLLHAYFGADAAAVAALRRVLTAGEFAAAFPDRGIT